MAENEVAFVDRIEKLVKPRLRGWLHLGAFPASVASGIVLVCLANGSLARAACAIFAGTVSLLFGVSAAYHRGRWSERTRDLLKRFDHANIFLFIAGSYTPFALLLVGGRRGQLLLWIVWGGALLGVALRTIWINGARWLSAPVYLALGWTAAFFVPDLLHSGAVGVFVLVVVGGALYSLGGMIYGLRRPDPWPRTFGFHEVFHTFTIAGWIVQYVAVSMVAYSYR
jgi:hemolysin III